MVNSQLYAKWVDDRAAPQTSTALSGLSAVEVR